MRLLADEGVDAAIVAGLRTDGHDGISNAEKARLVTRAIREHETDLSGGFTVIQHGTIRIRRA
jgi:hypothetical protein